MNSKEASRTVSTFVSNVHGFLTKYGIKNPDEVPYENAIVFDEAQRAWDARAVEKKHGIAKSEPDLVLGNHGEIAQMVYGDRAGWRWTGDSHRRGWPGGLGQSS